MDNRYSKPAIGKNVIDSLTLSMYEDPRFIFREYIQNSADQIDKAVKEGLLENDQGDIHINIDIERRRISIEDNATGIAESQVQPILLDIANSTKERGVNKGFRGIGRLGGLAYCQTLIFETSFKGEKTKSILTWDAARLNDIINNRKDRQDAAAVISEITSFHTVPEKASEHYFRVIMEGVSSEELLNKESVENYLSMVAPVPFPTQFVYKSKIYNELKSEGIHLDEYRIFLNTDQLFKGYSTSIYDLQGTNQKAKSDELIDIAFFKEADDNNNLLYWGWYGVSLLKGQMQSVNKARGFRLRKANIQIGDEETLSRLQKERRFNTYFFGEVHAIHPQLVPNARRDYFIDNQMCKVFQLKLKDYFFTHISNLCRQASNINATMKKIQAVEDMEKQFKQKQQNGFDNHEESKGFREKFESKKKEALDAVKKLTKIGKDAKDTHEDTVKKILNRAAPKNIVIKVESIELPANRKTKLRVNTLKGLSKEEKKLLGRVFMIIRDVFDPSTAENLIKKIEEDI